MDSPFAHLFNTNSPPSDAEMNQLRNFVSVPMKELSRIDSEISRLRELIADLYDQRKKLSKHIDAHRALISPIRRLPQELFQEIFIRCRPTDGNSAMSSLESPMLLCCICSAWRMIALSTPELWSSLHVVVSPDTPEGHHRLRSRCELARVWLSRSGSCPLSISLAAVTNGDINKAMVSQLMECLIPYSQRWKVAHFMVPYSSLKPLTALTQEDVPLLEIVKVLTSFHMNPDADDGSGNILGFLSAAPRLRSVYFRSNFGVWPLPWTSLTGLHLAGSGWRAPLNLELSAALEILDKCPNLTTCSLTLQTTPTHNLLLHAANPLLPAANPPLPAAPLISVTLPDLWSFCVSGGNLVPFLGNLILPALRDLEIRDGDIRPISSSPVLPLLSGHLERLCMHSVAISEDTLIEFLQANSSLTELIVKDWAPGQTVRLDRTGEPIICERILKLLTLTEGSTEAAGPLCPNLEMIRVTSCGTFSDELLLGFIQSRRNPILPGIAHLKRADMSLYRKIKLDILRRAHRLRNEELEFNLNPGADEDHPWEGLDYHRQSHVLRIAGRMWAQNVYED